MLTHSHPPIPFRKIVKSDNNEEVQVERIAKQKEDKREFSDSVSSSEEEDQDLDEEEDEDEKDYDEAVKSVKQNAIEKIHQDDYDEEVSENSEFMQIE